MSIWPSGSGMRIREAINDDFPVKDSQKTENLTPAFFWENCFIDVCKLTLLTLQNTLLLYFSLQIYLLNNHIFPYGKTSHETLAFSQFTHDFLTSVYTKKMLACKYCRLPFAPARRRLYSQAKKIHVASGIFHGLRVCKEPITGRLQLPLIPVTAFSQTDLFLVRIYLEFRSPQAAECAFV